MIMKKTLYTFFILLLVLVAGFILSPDLRSHTKSLFERIALWLYPNNLDRNAELLKILLSVFAGIGVLFGIYVSWWRARTTEESVKLQSKAIEKQGEQIQLAAKSQIDERFSNAIEHLGSEKEPVLLGGIAELHQIAKENRNDYAEVVFNILCSYIRSNTHIHNKNADDFNSTAIQTIINYLFKPKKESENPYKDFKADLGHSNLLGANLNDCDFTGADFTFCYMPSLENVILKSADIGKARFSVATLKNVNLSNAKVGNTTFHMAHLEDVTFENCRELLTVHFIDSELKNVNFENAEIYGSSFLSSLLSNVSFNNSQVMTTTFACSILSQVSFNTSKAMYELDFRVTGFTGVTFKGFMSNSKFNGCDNYYYNLRPFIEERLKQRSGQKADMSSISYNTTTFSNCKTDLLSQNDVDEINKVYEKLTAEPARNKS